MARSKRSSSRPVSAPCAPRESTLYKPLDFVLVRAPLLPFETYRALSDQAGSTNDGHIPNGKPLLPDDPYIRRALAVGSNELLNELERAAHNSRDSRQAQRKLLRYLIRMSTRPTPFGLFAGVALGQWGDCTDLALAGTRGSTRTRPDMEWLLRLVMDLESRPEVRQHLCLVANSAATVTAGRVHLAERAPRAGDGIGPEVSLRATRAALRALALAREPIAYADLSAALIESFPGVTPTKVDRLLTELWEQTLLLTDLRPPLTVDNPARYVADRLARVPSAAAELAALEALLAASADWDALPAAEAARAYQQLQHQANAVPNARSDTPLMVDMRWALGGERIHAAVGAEAARAAELLLRLTPLPDGLPYVTSYRHAFEAKYGHDREVPLLELLDPHFGLGAPAHYGGAAGISAAKSAQRARTLLDLALTAIRDRQRVVDLDPDTLARLETWAPSPATAPSSLDLYVFVAAPSAAALDAGEFQIIVGPNLGAMAAGRNLGRFADMLAPTAGAALREAAAAEESRDPRRVWAELVYLPRNCRAANVTIRPAVRRHEIVLGTSPGLPSAQVIPLDALTVGTRNGRFYVRWPAQDAEIVVCAGHMLNHTNAPAVVRFLSEVSRDGIAQISSFDWGPAASFPFRPRVQVGRIVLAPAEWRIDTLNRQRDLPTDSPPKFRAAVERWRAQWQVPQLVALTMGDNRLLLDLEDDRQLDEFRAELHTLREGGAILLQEVLPTPDQVWLPGPGGHFVTELVVSLALKAPASIDQAPARVTPDAAPAPTKQVHEPMPQRACPPGSEWLFVKLYCPRPYEEDLIAGPMLDFAEAMHVAGLTDEWFFIRYTDPDPHIRLRFRGTPERLSGQLMPRICAWAGELMRSGACIRFGFDTYERELERYGGTAGMALAESLFAADSRASAQLLRLIRGGTLALDRTMVGVLAVDDLLAGLGLEEHQRLQWYRASVFSRRETGNHYRQHKLLLRSLLGDPGWLCAQPAGDTVNQILATRRAALVPIAARLGELERQGSLSRPFATLCQSYVHLHCNRLFGGPGAAEGTLLGLLLRTREGLERAPTLSPAARLDQRAS